MPTPAHATGAKRRPLGDRLVQLTLLVLPPITVLLVGISWLVAAAPSSFVYVRLFGGPTDTEGPWTGRVQVIERASGTERPAARTPVRIVWAGDGGDSNWRGETDEDGWAEVRVERPSTARELHVAVFASDQARPAAEGRARLSTAAWLAGARRASGRIEGRTEGDLRVDVSVSKGVLAVPFPGRLEIEVGGPSVGEVELRWVASHLEITTPEPLRTDGQGRAQLVVTPRGHATSLELRAEGARGSARWFSTLPVVAGAMSAELAAGELHIRSPIERDVAWYTWITLGGRLGGGSVSLEADGLGAASGSLVVPPDLLERAARDELWVVVSSEPDARSPAAVGWPLGMQRETLDLAEQVLLDGASAGEAHAARSQSLLRWASTAYGALATLIVLVLFGGRVRGDRAAAWERLSGEERAVRVATVGERRLWPLLVALLCLGLGLALATLIGLLWIR